MLITMLFNYYFFKKKSCVKYQKKYYNEKKNIYMNYWIGGYYFEIMILGLFIFMFEIIFYNFLKLFFF